MSSRTLVEQLAGQHDAHLRWLRIRLQGRLASDEIEDVLQAAYARALTALSGPDTQRPVFSGAVQEVAWLRRIALNHAYDVLRERHGRTGEERTPRPAPGSVDDGACAQLIADVDVESEVVEAVQRDAQRPLVLAAIARLDDRHRQILQLRYGQGLPPAAVMVLVGLDRRQWEGRHTRALKAFGRALARLPISGECRRTRTLLRTAPAALLERADGVADDHVASCLSCAAFSSAARFAMAGLPLPLAIEPWRLDAADVFSAPSPNPACARAPAEAITSGTGALGSIGSLCAVLAASGALALAALANGSPPGASPEQTAPAASRPAAIAGDGRGARLAAHLTPRQALERRAREMARRRATARPRRSAGGSATDPRPPTLPARASDPGTASAVAMQEAPRAPGDSSSAGTP